VCYRFSGPDQESRAVLPRGRAFSPNSTDTRPAVPATGTSTSTNSSTSTTPAAGTRSNTELSSEDRRIGRRRGKDTASVSRGVLRLVDDTEYDIESRPTTEDEVGQKRSSASVVMNSGEAKKMVISNATYRPWCTHAMCLVTVEG